MNFSHPAVKKPHISVKTRLSFSQSSRWMKMVYWYHRSSGFSTVHHVFSTFNGVCRSAPIGWCLACPRIPMHWVSDLQSEKVLPKHIFHANGILVNPCVPFLDSSRHITPDKKGEKPPQKLKKKQQDDWLNFQTSFFWCLSDNNTSLFCIFAPFLKLLPEL